MSSFLYRIGRASFRRRGRVLAGWLVVLALLGLLAATVGGKYDDSFKIPGAESTIALDQLRVTFPEAADATATVLITAPEGSRMDDPHVKAAVKQWTRDLEALPYVNGVIGPYNEHIDGLISADPAVYARLPKVQQDESRTQGLDRLELIRFLQVAQTITVHHGALAFLLGINALRASEAAGVRIEDYADTMRGYRVLHLVGKGHKPATMPVTVPVLRVLEACRGQRTTCTVIVWATCRNRISSRRSSPWVRDSSCCTLGSRA